MTQIRCPNCGQMNRLSALQCTQCSLPFSNLPSSAFVDAGPQQQSPTSSGFPSEATQGGWDEPAYRLPVYQDTSDLGRKTFFWYRAYCALLTFLYLGIAILGVGLAMVKPETREYSSNEIFVMGIIYAVIGVVFFLISLVALLLPPKPYNWIVGIIMIAIGMTSCCFWPMVIPLLIYWLKPETKAFFGRN